MKKIQKNKNGAFIQLPKVLLEAACYAVLSLYSKVLYALLAERSRLSAANGWRDDKGRTFIYFPLSDVQRLLGCCHDSATKYMRELEEVGLLTRVKQGLGRPDKLIVHDIPGDDGTYCGFVAAESPLSGVPDDRTPDSGDVATNNNYIKNNNNKTIDGYDDLVAQVKEAIEYDVLAHRRDRDMVDDIVELLADAMSGTSPTIRVNGDERPREQVMRRFRSLNCDHVEYVLDRLKEVKPTVSNIRAYLLTALYNAPATMDSYYTADARAWLE